MAECEGSEGGMNPSPRAMTHRVLAALENFKVQTGMTPDLIWASVDAIVAIKGEQDIESQVGSWVIPIPGKESEDFGHLGFKDGDGRVIKIKCDRGIQNEGFHVTREVWAP